MVFSINSDESGPRNFAAFQALATKLNATAVLDTTGSNTTASASGSAASASATSGAGSTSTSVVVALGAVLFAVATLF
jgi:hypothetical protein